MADRLRVTAFSRLDDPALAENQAIDLVTYPPDELATFGADDLAGTEVLVSFNPDLTASLLAELADAGLTQVVRPGAGFDNIDLDAATEHGVLVSHAPEGPANAVAEGTIGLILSCLRQFHAHNAVVREVGWDRRLEFRGREVRDATVGVVGLGIIGKRVATLLGAFGSELLAADPYVSQAAADDFGVTLVDLDDLLARSDVVTLHVPLTDETHHLIGTAELDRMRDSAVLVNAARGPVVDNAALAAALRSDTIAGAAIDVFEGEPDIPSNPLAELDQTEALLTPHILGPTAEARARIDRTVVEAIEAIVADDIPRNVLNPEVLGGEIPEAKVSPAFRP